MSKIVAIQNCGLAVNRLTTKSQTNGSVIMGLSNALLEERIMDPQLARHLQKLERENTRLKKLVADQALDMLILKEAACPIE